MNDIFLGSFRSNPNNFSTLTMWESNCLNFTRVYKCTFKVREGRRHVIWASCTKTVIYWLIYKISKHMIHQKIAYFQAF